MNIFKLAEMFKINFQFYDFSVIAVHNCMLCHPNYFYLLKLAKLSLWYSLDCQVWVWVCWGQSRVTEGNKLTDQDRDTPKRRQWSQYKWLSMALAPLSNALAPLSIALAAPQAPPPTHLFLSFGEMFHWRKSLVCCFGALGPPSIALPPPPKICQSDSTKQSFNNF